MLTTIQILSIQTHVIWWQIFVLRWLLHHFNQCEEEQEEGAEEGAGAGAGDSLLDPPSPHTIYLCLYNLSLQCHSNLSCHSHSSLSFHSHSSLSFHSHPSLSFHSHSSLYPRPDILLLSQKCPHITLDP